MRSKEYPLEESDVAIVAFLGLTGSGLSSFIDRAAGKEPGKNTGHNLKSHTKKIRTVEVSHPTTRRPHILVDTPGFVDGRSEDALLKLTKWLKDAYSEQAKLSGIVYMHRISDNRMPYSPIMSLSKLKGLCKPDFESRIVLATTMWSHLQRETAVQRKLELENKNWKPMINQGSEVMEYKDTMVSAWEIIDRVVGQFDTEPTVPRSTPSRTAPTIRKSRSFGALLARNEVYPGRDKGQFRHASVQNLAKTKRPLGERILGWFKK